MGVQGLWSIVQPCARPVKIDTLNKKRLAVDASIWIYQFLKAVRDKEGNALRNSHVVGFFRRICKLLFFGIKPVFVFDGGAPVLKRQTISGRKQRREGRREDAVRTAGKLLAVQMHRRAEEEEQRRRDDAQRLPPREEEPLPENMIYVDELQMTQGEREQNRKFKKKDQYHLPDLNVPMSEMGGPQDPRVMSLEELQEYAHQFDQGENINVYDFSKIDFNSPFFTSLPASDRYNILNAARLRSRLRMGYSRDQLELMFPDRMAFSRFQIDRVKERNELTQRLMQVGTVEDGTFGLDGSGRVAGEKGREYVLVKNPGVEGGWALGVIRDRDSQEGQEDKPIDIENPAKSDSSEADQDEAAPSNAVDSDEILKRREAFYGSRRRQIKFPTIPSGSPAQSPSAGKSDWLFVEENDGVDPSGTNSPAQNAIQNTTELDAGRDHDSDDEQTQMQIAIAETVATYSEQFQESQKLDLETAKEKERESASVASEDKFNSLEIESHNGIEPGPERFSDDEEPTLEECLSRFNEPEAKPDQQSQPVELSAAGARDEEKRAQFSGPLPFEKLDLGTSILGKKKLQNVEQATSGGFEKEVRPETKRKSPTEAPPWFFSDVEKEYKAQIAFEGQDRRKEKQDDDKQSFQFAALPTLSKKQASEPVDVDALGPKQNQVVTIDSSDDDPQDSDEALSKEVVIKDSELRMGDVADRVRIEPPAVPEPANMLQAGANFEVPSTHAPTGIQQQPEMKGPRDLEKNFQRGNSGLEGYCAQPEKAREASEEPYEWEESDHEQQGSDLVDGGNFSEEVIQQDNERKSTSPSRSESPDVYVPSDDFLESLAARKSPMPRSDEEQDVNASGVMPENLGQNSPPEQMYDDQDLYSDPDDDELMEQMAVEAEEHARFASSLNNKSQQQNIEDYERELKALRNQQKKDRRDADEVTNIMISECQQLLKLFGLPYVTAPMEAEAQCAELVSLGLVDGIVTDDSDIFLFGGTRIYKNMFNQAKYVECYLTSDLERDFDLTRQKLIRVAHLLGSDYTEGLQNVGPVTALEILTEFPDNLDDFKTWWTGVQQGVQSSDGDKTSSFRKKFKKNATKLFLPPAFPDPRVDLAYTNPEVDSDPSEFQWGVPDLGALRSYLMSTIGWNQERTDEVLVPVIRDMNRRENEGTQANITSFLGGNVGAGAFAPRVRSEGKSARMERALEQMAQRARKKRKTDRKAGDAPANNDDAAIATSGSLVDGSSEVAKDEQLRPSRKRPLSVGASEEVPGDKIDAPARKRPSSKAKRKGSKRKETG